jgi:hypothetical protein
MAKIKTFYIQAACSKNLLGLLPGDWSALAKYEWEWVETWSGVEMGWVESGLPTYGLNGLPYTQSSQISGACLSLISGLSGLSDSPWQRICQRALHSTNGALYVSKVAGQQPQHAEVRIMRRADASKTAWQWQLVGEEKCQKPSKSSTMEGGCYKLSQEGVYNGIQHNG